MSKDPAFLFYSKDFYEGTRMLLPDERACLVDLMIYQHQNGPIPDDLKRVKLYCTGVDEATLKATLEAKFKLTSEGWINEKLDLIVSERESFKGKQVIYGKIGQFWKKAKSNVKASEYKSLRSFVYTNYTSENLITELEKFKGSHEGLLKALLKQCVNEDVIVNEDKDNKKGAKSKFNPPVIDQVKDFFQEKGYKEEIAIKAFNHYDLANWEDTTGKKVKNWKQKMNTVWFMPEHKISESENGMPEHLRNLPEDHHDVINWEMEEQKRKRQNGKK